MRKTIDARLMSSLTIVVTGELDIATVAGLDAQIRKAEREARHVVVDLRRLTFVDSSGLHLLTSADDRIRAAGGRLTLVRGPKPIDRVFDVLGLNDLLDVVDTPPEPSAVSVLSPGLRMAEPHPAHCPACRREISPGSPTVDVNGCEVHVACALHGVYDEIPRPDWAGDDGA
ncbi:MAG: STAS domain-containing protein [Gaiellaceae bacterium]